jgi:hypothetical protein
MGDLIAVTSGVLNLAVIVTSLMISAKTSPKS